MSGAKKGGEERKREEHGDKNSRWIKETRRRN